MELLLSYLGKTINTIPFTVSSWSGIIKMLFFFLTCRALHFINDPKAFIGLSFLVRIIEALSATSFHTAIFAIVADTFPGAVAVTFVGLFNFVLNKSIKFPLKN